MTAQIISNTPTWVFVLFLALLVMGLLQLKPMVRAYRRVLIFPLIFLIWSCYGVISSFGWSPTTLLPWAASYVLSAWLVAQLRPDIATRFYPETQTFYVAGSVVPLTLMMGIFFLKYFVGVSTAMHTRFADSEAFAPVIGLLYGALSGVFAGRAGRLLKLAKSSA